MSPIPYAALRLVARDDDDDDDDCTGFCGNSYVRWIIAIIVICCSIAALCLALALAMKRVTGRWTLGIPVRPTTMRDPEAIVAARSDSRRQRRSRRRRNEPDEADPVPAYNATPGTGDAGYYDVDGNYIAHEPPPYVPPKAKLRTEEVELDNVTTHSDDVVHHSLDNGGRGIVEETTVPTYTSQPSQRRGSS